MTTGRTLLAALLAFAFPAADLLGQAIRQPRHVFDGGGGKGASDNYAVHQTVGQPFVQKGSGPTMTLGGGFLWPPVEGSPIATTMLNGVSAGWNLLSVPLDVEDFSATALYPLAVSNAFSYAAGYVATDTLEAGAGYWLKFAGDDMVSFYGYLRTLDTVGVSAGWNMVGALSLPVWTGSIGAEPRGLVLSNFFAFEGAYVVSDSLRPGKGHWVKASEDGWLILNSSPGAIPATARARIVPDGDLPPEPPGNPDAGVSEALPSVYALYQNFPNPFNPETEIRFDLPVGGDILLRVYNILGEEVVTLANGAREAGFLSVKFDASDLPSGVYLYRLTAGTFTMAKKLMVLK